MHLALRENRVWLVCDLGPGGRGHRVGANASAELLEGDRAEQPGRLLGYADGGDPSVGMVRAHERGMDHAGPRQIVQVAALAANQARVLAADQRLADQAHASWSRIQSATTGR